MPDPSDEHLAEAKRLALLPEVEQQAIIAMHRAIAADLDVPAPDREYARERADMLAMHLRRLFWNK